MICPRSPVKLVVMWEFFLSRVTLTFEREVRFFGGKGRGGSKRDNSAQVTKKWSFVCRTVYQVLLSVKTCIFYSKNTRFFKTRELSQKVFSKTTNLLV